ncbi:hypothetical protein EYF80_058006 [Liparis tanakae]|uniref:Uncharacterized protein n=1 Tax=Liparis tanakae TaxID=230148 RepID=A0A4Z2ESD3_9TELE|nr:hypothetical protein EYF80_058006 [Liparis tanakae]
MRTKRCLNRAAITTFHRDNGRELGGSSTMLPSRRRKLPSSRCVCGVCRVTSCSPVERSAARLASHLFSFKSTGTTSCERLVGHEV